VEKALPKPDPAVLDRRLAQQRQQALAQQRAAEQAELQQQREQAAAQAELQHQRQLQAQAAADARRLAQQRAQQEAAARAVQQAANATPIISSPRFRQRPQQPDYPRAAMEAGVEGTAIVRVTLSPSGSITAISLHRSTGHAALDAAAVKAVRGWSFMPAVRNGQAIASIVQVPVNFRLSD
jgi:protein TonB